VDDYESARAAHGVGRLPFLAVQLRGLAAAQLAEQIARMIRGEIRQEDGR
jgi:hypothetical protein